MAVKKNASWAQVCTWSQADLQGPGGFCGWVVLSTTQHLSLPPLHGLLCSACWMQLCFCTIHSQRGGWNLAKLNIGFTAQFSWVGLIDRDFSQPYGGLAAFPRGFLIRLLQPLLICHSQPFSILTATFPCIFTFSRLSWLLQCHNSYNFFLISVYMDGLTLKQQPVPSQGGSHTVPHLQPNSQCFLPTKTHLLELIPFRVFQIGCLPCTCLGKGKT